MAAVAPVKGQTRSASASASTPLTKGQLRPLTIKYDMFASLSTKGCNYCGTTK